MEIIIYEATLRKFQFVSAANLETGDHKTSCGHVIKSSGLKEWCKALLDEGGFTFNCPKCAKEWPWQEVRKIAQLTQDECKSFEEQLNRIMKPRAESYKKCPNCRLYVQRMDPEKLCVQCLPCSEKSNKTIRFCWGCLREWKNPDAQSNSCGNTSCSLTALLLSCDTIDDQASPVYGCPSVRACPSCEALMQHSGGRCPSVSCPSCHCRFCFRCLESFGHHRGIQAGSSRCCIVERQELTGQKVASSHMPLYNEAELITQYLLERAFHRERQRHSQARNVHLQQQGNQQPGGPCVIF
ncbi:probable E3 ubiquitin-protein ligase RNF144A-A [Chiloscyllium punctatum]|uniref:probable E3 ubiquitin-protein ligase RNF144A-A n=1 Tax=Chiloscyllium punctatum TaxID=137246 RepID=UPI003B63C7C7